MTAVKILLFGGAGQLGFEITKRAADLNFELVSPVASEVDIGSLEQVRFIAQRAKPDVLINAAAYTAVDQAETERDEAFRVNCDGARNVALVAKEVGSQVVYVSTDYVFDGTTGAPLTESDPTNPLGVYGATKLAGERAVMEAFGPDALVVRTSSLHGQRGQNFVHTMLKLFEDRDMVRVVSDQYMSPTWAGWLAEVILDLIRARAKGVVHASCAGVITWLDFARKIHELGSPQHGESWRAELAPISAQELGRPAKRPRYSAFNTGRLEQILGRPALPWEQGLRNHLREIGRLRGEGVAAKR
ncbi:MAG: dTDP-4-dehydrorhamnose reductase [Proteobacteria bacterium]|nr:dTDP-4-dehydrorhamnose reductase [Pseudomonadota bacterium]